MTMTFDEALHIATQLSPLPALAHEALKVLVAQLALRDAAVAEKLVQGDQAREVQPEVIDMIANGGIYVLGDTATPGIAIPVVSALGRLYSVTFDAQLNPERFLPTVTINGPFLPKVVSHG